ncbi:aminodeoxychorismate synthase component I [Skermanella mucosa]|uniref:aminodeoxychorismate synthase component I n=1 Tax=Skermanella mucosa TaxID=1789672 RepID=UPI00192BC311|nr:aminodeoxychorismate synthase component I [Skermanella mucosa]UEM20606.1 aminodeoxychorismate synthase component I [Skermanella mucosa]
MIIREIPWRDPLPAFAPWASDPFAVLFDSAADGDARSRWSYLAVEPFRTILAGPGGVAVDGLPAAGDPFAALEAELGRTPVAPGAGPAPWCGGAAGFLGYGLGRHLERLPCRHGDDLGLPDMAVGLYDVIVAFDHRERRCWITSVGGTGGTGKLDAVAARLESTPPAPAEPPPSAGPWRAELTRTEYERRVGRVLDYIRAGDIFQANFTGRFTAGRPAALGGFDLYRRLRDLSPAPFAAYAACGPRLALASASPERFLKLSADGHVETRPIKGTLPRGTTAEEDSRNARTLAASAKDRAENLMIVDLMRNDLGRVALTGSVTVPSLYALESFASVHHLVSVVEADLRPGVGPVGLLRATFPGGSVTGAPKIRAMEIIDELEACRRGPYCGALAWIGFDGAMDSSILIRTLMVTPDRIAAHAGGGIVSDSDPAREYEEMLVKITPLLRAADPEWRRE